MININCRNRFEDNEWELECEPFQIAPDVYYIGTKYVGSYLLDTGEGLAVIDQAFAESVYLLFESIRKLGFNPKDIRWLLISHGHFDHCGGTRLFQEYTGAKVYMSKEDALMIKERPDWAHFGAVNWIDFEPDEYYDDDTLLKLGKFTIRTVLTPGHTPGTTSFFFDVKDVVEQSYTCGLHGGIGLNTLSPEYYKENPDWPQALLPAFVNSLEKLLKEKVDIVLPSHPNQVPIMHKAGKYDEKNNPFIDPIEWEKLLTRRLEEAKKLL